MVERADADVSGPVARAAVVAPERDLAGGAAQDRLPLAAERRRLDAFRRGLADQFHPVRLDHRVEGEGTAGFALAPAAMAAVDNDGVVQQPVADLTAGAAAFGALAQETLPSQISAS